MSTTPYDFARRPVWERERRLTMDQNVTASDHTGGNVPERPDLKKWLVRRVECMRGTVDVTVEVFPAFNYAQDNHTTEITDLGKNEHDHHLQRVIFKSEKLSLELNVTIDCGDEPDRTCPQVRFEKCAETHALGDVRYVHPRTVIKTYADILLPLLGHHGDFPFE